MAIADMLPVRPWRAPGCERPLVCWRDDQLAALAGALEDVLGAWATGWGLQDLPRVTCAAAGLALDGAWRELQLDRQPAGWMQEVGPELLVTSLFAQDARPGPIASELAMACEKDAIARVLGLLRLSSVAGSGDGQPDASVPWAGNLGVTVSRPLGWRLLLQANVVRAWIAAQGLQAPADLPCKSAALASALDALVHRRIKLDVRLEGCELQLGALQGLQSGDVVRLRHRVEAPAAVTDGAGTPLFDGYLGRRGGLKAIELTAAKAPAENAASHEGVLP